MTKDMPSRKEQLGLLRQAIKNRIPVILIHGNGLSDLIEIEGKYGTINDVVRQEINSSHFMIGYDIASGLQMSPDDEKEFRRICKLDVPLPSEVNNLSGAKNERLRTGMMSICPELLPPLPTHPVAVFNCMNMVVSCSKRPVLLFLPHIDAIAPNSNSSDIEERKLVLTLTQFIQNVHDWSKGSMMILTVNFLADLAKPLCEQRGVETINIPLPSEEDRLDFLAAAKMPKSNVLAKVSGGLAIRDFDLLRRKDMLGSQFISQEKSCLINSNIGDLLRIKEPRFGLADGLGGCYEIKTYFEEIIPGIKKMDARIVPPAIILMGPPGTGKTRLAECLAWEIGVPFVEVQSLFDPFVGVSERNAQRVSSMIQEMAPCVAFIDDMDQNEAPRGSFVGDSGVGNRVRKVFFDIIGDQRNRGRIMWLFATNMPELIDSAYKRSGRGSVRMPMPLPDDVEMADIIRVMINQYRLKTPAANIPKIVSSIRQVQRGCVSGADIEEISLSAWRKSQKQGRGYPNVDDWKKAAEEMVTHEEPADGSMCEYLKMEINAVRARSSNVLLSARGREILKLISRA